MSTGLLVALAYVASYVIFFLITLVEIRVSEGRAVRDHEFAELAGISFFAPIFLPICLVRLAYLLLKFVVLGIVNFGAKE